MEQISSNNRQEDLFPDPIVIIANGEFPYHPKAIKIIKKAGIIICTDGSADKLIEFGTNPDFIIGDFDSTSIKNKNIGKWIKAPDQNKTDLEKTFDWCITNQINKTFLLGAGGGREDHLFGNLFTVSNYHNKIDCKVVTNNATIYCSIGKNIIDTLVNQDVSIFAMEKINRISTNGLKYNLNEEILEPSARAICNTAISKQFHINSSGRVLIFLNHPA